MGRQKRKVESSFRQFILETSDAVAILKTSMDHCSKMLVELRNAQYEELEASQQLYSSCHSSASLQLSVDICGCLTQCHLQLSVLLNQVDKLYSLVSETNEQSTLQDGLDVSTQIGSVLEFAKSNQNQPRYNGPPNYSVNEALIDNLKNILSGSSLSNDDLHKCAEAVSILRHAIMAEERLSDSFSCSLSISSHLFDHDQVSDQSAVQTTAEELILLSLTWMIHLHKHAKDKPGVVAYACCNLEEESAWLDYLDDTGANSGELKKELELISQRLLSSASIHGTSQTTMTEYGHNIQIRESTSFTSIDDALNTSIASTSRDPENSSSSFSNKELIGQRSRIRSARSDRLSASNYTDEETGTNTVVSYL